MRFAGFCALVVAAFCMAMSVPAWSTGTLPVEQMHLDRETADYKITMLYPRTGNAAIDRQVEDWAKAQADYFVRTAGGPDPGHTKHTLDVSFTVTRNDAEMFETLFEYESYTGGAHPGGELYTLNFLPDGTRVFFPEIFGLKGMDRVSELAIDHLIDELTKGQEPTTDADSIRNGAKPHPGAFEAFTLNKESLTLYFQQYEIASYAAGPQITQLPLARLRGIMRDDWHVPQPSFDCDKAATPVEHAICSDVTLSRLDRKLAEAYYWQIALGSPADNARFQNEQRAFLAQRDTACAGQTDAALTACLVGRYQARLKPFNRQPE